MANYKRKKSRYQYKCTMCNSSRFATESGELTRNVQRNLAKEKEELLDYIVPEENLEIEDYEDE